MKLEAAPIHGHAGHLAVWYVSSLHYASRRGCTLLLTQITNLKINHSSFQDMLTD